MKLLTLLVVLVLAFTGAGYVRREWRQVGEVAYLVIGSRDRALAGKARRRARQGRAA